LKENRFTARNGLFPKLKQTDWKHQYWHTSRKSRKQHSLTEVDMTVEFCIFTVHLKFAETLDLLSSIFNFCSTYFLFLFFRIFHSTKIWKNKRQYLDRGSFGF